MIFKLGLENLNEEQLKGNIAIVTNNTGVTSDLQQNIDWLQHNGVKIKKIFAPEHGFYNALKNGEDVPDETYNGIPVSSIYSENRKPFSKERIDEIDTIIFDIQDSGSRPYTHLSILKEVLEASRETGIRIIVCDRPAPLSGSKVEGPMMERENMSFIGAEQIPLRYGMTIGELANFMNQKIDANLEISKMLDYNRDGYYDRYMKFFVPPSLNLPNLDSVINFSGLVLLEATKASVGRGTPYPFLQFGYSKPIEMPLSRSNSFILRKTIFVPTIDPLKDENVEGYFIHISNREKFSSIELAISSLKEFYKIDYNFIDFRHMLKLYGSKKIEQYIKDNTRIEEIRDDWKEENRDFMELRENILFYK